METYLEELENIQWDDIFIGTILEETCKNDASRARGISTNGSLQRKRAISRLPRTEKGNQTRLGIVSFVGFSIRVHVCSSLKFSLIHGHLIYDILFLIPSYYFRQCETRQYMK